MKHQYSIFEAKAKLSEIIKTVQKNHEIIITDRSKPVVKIIPYQPVTPKHLSDRLEELTQQGMLSKASSLLQTPVQTPRRDNLLATFLRERD